MAIIRTLVVSEVRLHREGLVSSLVVDPAIEVVGAVGSLRDALAMVRQCPVEIVLLDLPPTPENLSDLTHAVRTGGAARFVALGAADPDEDGMAWAQAGVAGIVERSSSLQELRRVLETIVRGEFLCSPRIAAALLRCVFALAAERQSPEPIDQLTAREQEMLALIGQGLTNKEIARSCSLRLSTVKNHVHSILAKLGVHGRAAAAVLALESGALPPVGRPRIAEMRPSAGSTIQDHEAPMDLRVLVPSRPFPASEDSAFDVATRVAVGRQVAEAARAG